jgi:hypothetical protein
MKGADPLLHLGDIVCVGRHATSSMDGLSFLRSEFWSLVLDWSNVRASLS